MCNPHVMHKPRFAVLVGMVLAAAASRLIPHPPNFAPIAAMALFSGANFSDKRLAFGVPFAALILSDLLLGFYDGLAVVYAAFAMIVGLGFWLRDHRSNTTLAAATFVSAVLFFVVTNFAFWLSGVLYPRTLVGLSTCCIAALPFFWNTLLSDIFFTAVLFGGVKVLEKAFPAVREPIAARC